MVPMHTKRPSVTSRTKQTEHVGIVHIIYIYYIYTIVQTRLPCGKESEVYQKTKGVESEISFLSDGP